jgi:hypothetical protein
MPNSELHDIIIDKWSPPANEEGVVVFDIY